MKIKEYDIVLGTSSAFISGRVTVLMKDGWQPYGNPFTQDGKFYQAMVKYEKDEQKLLND
jgi:hypothetical protein